MNIRIGVVMLIGMLGGSLVHAAPVASGKVTRFHSSGGGQFAVFLSETTAPGVCPSNWYYSARSDYVSPDDYKAVMALALTAYAQAKRITVFAYTSNCTERFTAIDTVD